MTKITASKDLKPEDQDQASKTKTADEKGSKNVRIAKEPSKIGEPVPGSSTQESSSSGSSEQPPQARESSKSTSVPAAVSVIVQRTLPVTSEVDNKSKSKDKDKRKHYHATEITNLQKKAPRVPCTTPRDFQAQALDAHNRFRRLHGVPPLVLDDDLSQVAQAWANQCASSKKMEHSKAAYGENVYFSSGMDVDGSQPVDAWYSEVQKFNFDNIDMLPGTGHFTQVVWENTKKLGIALAVGKNKNTYVVAEYDPPGNILGRFKENVLPPAH